MMPLSKNPIFSNLEVSEQLATISDQPETYLFWNSRPKNRVGGSLTPTQPRVVGPYGGRGICTLCQLYIYNIYTIYVQYIYNDIYTIYNTI